MRRVSKKQAAINRKLTVLVKKYLEDNPRCEYMMDDTIIGGESNLPCPRRATNVHHKRGRGRWTLVVETFMATCDYHHPQYIHFVAPKEARQKGYLLT